MYRPTLLLALVVGFLLAPSVLSQSMNDDSKSDIIATLRAEGSFSTLLDLFEKAGLTETLAGGGPYTVFAPSDSAFNGITVAEMSDDEVTNLTTRHVVMERLTASDAEQNGQALNMLGESIECRMDEETLRVNGTEVLRSNIEATNGLIHVVAAIISPSHEPEATDGY